MNDMTEEQRIEAARIRDEAAAAAQGDYTAWAHLKEMLDAKDAAIEALIDDAVKYDGTDSWPMNPRLAVEVGGTILARFQQRKLAYTTVIMTTNDREHDPPYVTIQIRRLQAPK